MRFDEKMLSLLILIAQNYSLVSVQRFFFPIHSDFNSLHPAEQKEILPNSTQNMVQHF